MKKRSAKLPLMNINRVSFIVASLSLSLIVAVYAEDITLAKLDVKTLVSKMTPLKGNTPAQWRVVWTGDASREATISWTSPRTFTVKGNISSR